MDRWFFRNPDTGYITVMDGDPKLHPGWAGWGHDLNADGCVRQPREKHTYARIFFDGVEQWGRKMKATQNDAVICNRGCETAQEPDCVCSCGGRNHGIAHKGQEEET